MDDQEDLILRLKCPESHVLRFYAHGEIRSRKDSLGSSFVSTANNLCCSACKEDFSIAELGGYYSCDEECDYDVCLKCARCDSGHLLTYGRAHLPKPNSDKICGRCKGKISKLAILNGEYL